MKPHLSSSAGSNLFHVLFFFFSEYFDVSILFKVLEPNVNFLSYSYIPFFFSCFSNLHFPYLQSNNPSFNSGSS